MLVVGSTTGQVRLVAYGISPIAEVDVLQAAQTTQVCQVDCAQLKSRHYFDGLLFKTWLLWTLINGVFIRSKIEIV